MKTGIHPNYNCITAKCSCGNIIYTKSTLQNNKELNLDVCNLCHPFYTGTQKIIDTKGRVERFKKKFKNIKF
ncbi:50S ribosomal protein L31 [Enterobacteriaceae endosymbiont of Neohaemonia nigricornis]|uniref:50S ribosomal protein L31 n=1 Tax=Enterobacteriaceae endosymbiont of Neohaemonia nigricornis TaxID=2675792 RepID=UPI001448FF58|nr:50S ribosomal protein L31 [Enterobacteriaceae endosymbiont of Neohaemonia nigricornis]QJC30570.1 50S ribosomal protein L31 [Enterobacteriaceae endosymbiont of Neohaemonia nigricornis]